MVQASVRHDIGYRDGSRLLWRHYPSRLAFGLEDIDDCH
jgi:hypothetical protein